MSQTFTTERISRLNEENMVLTREKAENKRRIESLERENSELKQAKTGSNNAEIGLSLIYMEKLRTAIGLLDELNGGLGKARVASESIRGDVDLDEKLRTVCNQNAGDLKNMLMSFQDKLPSSLSAENRELAKNIDGRVEQLQGDLAGVLSKILDFLGQANPNRELEHETLTNLNILVKRQLGGQ